MTEVPVLDLRTEVRKSLILTTERIGELGDYLGLDGKQITAVRTYCGWISRGLDVKAINLEDLVAVLNNRSLRLWIRRTYPDPNHGRFETTGDTFAIYASLVVDEIIAGTPF